MNKIIILLLFSIILIGCGGSKSKEIIVNNQPHHIHTFTIKLSDISRDQVFDRYVKWHENNSLKFSKSEILYKNRDAGLIGTNFVKDYVLRDKIKYVAFTVSADVNEEQAIFVFSDLRGLEDGFKSHAAAINHNEAEVVNMIVYERMIDEVKTYIKTNN